MSKFQADRSDPDAGHGTTRADIAFPLLSSKHRRYILYYLTRCTGTVELRELADQLVRWDGTPTDDRDRISTSLYHVHLPKLEESGVLTFNSTQRLIELEERADELKPYLELAAEDDFRTQVFDPEPKRGTE